MRCLVYIYERTTDALIQTLSAQEFLEAYGRRHEFALSAVERFNADESRGTEAVYVCQVQKRGKWVEI